MDQAERSGIVHAPRVIDKEMVTERYSTILSFRLDIPDPQTGEFTAFQDVEMRGQPRILGTVFDNDKVRVIGSIGKDQILRATEIHRHGLDGDRITHGLPPSGQPNQSASQSRAGKAAWIVRPVESVVDADDNGERITAGVVKDVLESTENHSKGGKQSRRNYAVAVINVKVEYPPLSGNYKNVTIRGMPDISGTVYVDDEVNVFGELTSDGVILARRVEKPGGTVNPVKSHDPRSTLRRTILAIGGIVILGLLALFAIFVGLGFLGFWDFLVDL